MRHRILSAFLLLFFSTAALAGITVSPTSLNFGTLTSGQTKTLVLTLKNDTKLSTAATAKVTFPYVVAPASFSIPNLSSMTLNVTLPATAPPRNHNGTLTITIPALLSGNPPKEINVAITGSVVAGTGPDLKVGTISVKTCAVNDQNTFRSCSIFVPLLTTGTTIIPAKTTILEARGTGPLTEGINQLLSYTPPDALPFIYVISQLPLDITTVTVKVIVDNNNQIAESNEANNTATKTLTVQ